MLLKTIEDIVDNYAANATDAASGVYRGFVRGGRWDGWNTVWPRYNENNRLHLVRAYVEIDSSAVAVKQGVRAMFGVLVRRGAGIVFLPPMDGAVQGYGSRLLFGPTDTEWGVAAGFPMGAVADGDICITSLVYQRYLP